MYLSLSLSLSLSLFLYLSLTRSPIEVSAGQLKNLAKKHSLSLLVHLPDFICPKSNNNSKTKYFSFLFQK